VNVIERQGKVFEKLCLFNHIQYVLHGGIVGKR
jgi:hypothetical protein